MKTLRFWMSSERGRWVVLVKKDVVIVIAAEARGREALHLIVRRGETREMVSERRKKKE